MSPNKITVSTHGHVAFLRAPATGQQALYALRSYDAGDVIQAFTAGSVHEAPTYLTVQRGEKNTSPCSPPSCNTVNTAAIRMAFRHRYHGFHRCYAGACRRRADLFLSFV